MLSADGYGVALVPLTRDKLELVRRWRNMECVSRFMEFRDEITPEMQREWFESVDNENNHYFVVTCGGKEVGLSNIKNIDREAGTGEAGIFIADPDCLNSPVPILVSICGLDFCFERLGLKEVYIKTADGNTSARRLNAALGYEPVGEAGEGGFRHYKLTKQAYYRHREQLIDLLYGTE